jgi:hypothetical protein
MLSLLVCPIVIALVWFHCIILQCIKNYKKKVLAIIELVYSSTIYLLVIEFLTLTMIDLKKHFLCSVVSSLLYSIDFLTLAMITKHPNYKNLSVCPSRNKSVDSTHFAQTRCQSYKVQIYVQLNAKTNFKQYTLLLSHRNIINMF